MFDMYGVSYMKYCCTLYIIRCVSSNDTNFKREREQYTRTCCFCVVLLCINHKYITTTKDFRQVGVHHTVCMYAVQQYVVPKGTTAVFGAVTTQQGQTGDTNIIRIFRQLDRKSVESATTHITTARPPYLLPPLVLSSLSKHAMNAMAGATFTAQQRERRWNDGKLRK